MKFEKSLILIRHAHRNKQNKSLDNGLTSKGQRQAEKTAKTLFRILSKSGIQEKTPLKFLSSPKKRCIETLEIVSRRFNSKIETDSLLLEQQENESRPIFEKRIHQFLDQWTQERERVTLICSHGDWLPIAVKILVKAPSEFKRGGWAEIRWTDGNAWIHFPNC